MLMLASCYLLIVSQSSTYAKNAFEVRDNTGACVLLLSAKSATEKEKWLKSFKNEQEIVQRDKESGEYLVLLDVGRRGITARRG